MQTSPDLPTTVDFGNNLVNYIEVSPDDVRTESQDSTEAPTPQETAAEELGEVDDPEKQQRYKQVLPVEAFSRIYPQYLLDYDEPEDTPQAQAAAAAIEKLETPPSLPGFLAKPILNSATLLKDDNSVLNMPNHTTLNHLATSSIKNGTLAVSATTRYRDKVCTTKPVCFRVSLIPLTSSSSMSPRSCTNRCLANRGSMRKMRIGQRVWSLRTEFGNMVVGKDRAGYAHTCLLKEMGLTALIGYGRNYRMVTSI